MKWLFVRHLTFKKVLNLIFLAIDFGFGRSLVRSKPIIIKMETSNLCNLRCPLCRQGRDGKDRKIEKRLMSLAIFKKILNQIYGSTFVIFLYHKGEPFLNKQILDMCSAAKEKNVATAISSNFSMTLSEKEIKKIVHSGLSYLIVSVDGLTQEVYEKYRIGGNVEKVLTNLKRLLDEKKRQKSATPQICWQYIEFDHNINEIEDAKRIAQKMGIDHFVLKKDVTLGYHQKGESKSELSQFKCKWLWSTAIFLHDGETVPCCFYDWDEKYHFGNALPENFMGIWNGEKYKKNRHFVCNLRDDKNESVFCGKCPFIQ